MTLLTDLCVIVPIAAEALHFEEAEDIEAEAAGLKPTANATAAAAAGAAAAAPKAPLSPSKDEAAIRKRMVDVMIAAAKERHAARLAAARKKAAEAKGAGELLGCCCGMGWVVVETALARAVRVWE